jgi:hypothetical protein
MAAVAIVSGWASSLIPETTDEEGTNKHTNVTTNIL